MAKIIYGPDGQPVSSKSLGKAMLSEEMAAPTITGVRSPISGYPGDGLTPDRLAEILRAADQGLPLDYFELAETAEERDAHYVGVLGTRKRLVAQTGITVEAASDKAEHVEHADMVRAWLKRDTLQAELFDILDAIGKGISFTEILWDSSEGDWLPARLIPRSQRFFTFDRSDLETPLLRELGGDLPLPAMKFITARIKSKSGLAVRSGIARVALWSWMFKAFTQKDWAIFSQTYGQPIRVGKYKSGATDRDKSALRNAVYNIAADCAAIIPDTMAIEFIESKTADKSGQLYRERCDWLDQQVSKAVLGQTATTDAIAGGHAVGKEHRKVQEDIANADCAALAAVLNRDLIKPWIDLQYGPQKLYPRLVIRDADDTDVTALSDALSKLVPVGLRVPQNWVRDKLGIPDPDGAEELLGTPLSQPAPQPAGGPFPQPAPKPKMQSATPAPDTVDAVLALMASGLDDGTALIIDHIRALAAEATSLPDLREKLMAAIPGLTEARLAEALQQALALSTLAGQADAAA
jgi:phage gp29-like protein